MKKHLIVIFYIFSLIIIPLESLTQNQWLYPRYDLENTCAVPNLILNIFEEPGEVWSVSPPANWFFRNNLVGDLNSDGNPEIIVVRDNYQTQETILSVLNHQNGSILWEKNLDKGTGYGGLFLTDLEKDGMLDIICSTWDSIYAINGADSSIIWNTGMPDGILGYTVTDMNSDSIADVVINDYGDPHRIYILDGTNGIELWSTETCGSAYNTPTAGDIDGDGNMEILCHNHLYDPSRERMYCWNKNLDEVWHFDATPTQEQFDNAPPELGYPPDYGYTSSILLDFDNDGEKEVAFGTSCNYYLLDKDTEVEWKVPMRKGHGVMIWHYKDGTTQVDNHGIGGPFGYAAADINGDKLVELVVSFDYEFRYEYFQDSIAIISDIIPANRIIALKGNDGSVLWEFEGDYVSVDSSIERMSLPVLVDLDGDSLQDVLVHSSDGHLYGIKGTTGEQVWKYPFDYPNIHTLEVYGDKDKSYLLINTLNNIMLWSFEQATDIPNIQNTDISNFKLSQNYPNPFNPVTKIDYQLYKPSYVEIKVYDISGKFIDTLVKQYQYSGRHSVVFKANGLASGLYIYKMKIGANEVSHKMLLLR